MTQNNSQIVHSVSSLVSYLSGISPSAPLRVMNQKGSLIEGVVFAVVQTGDHPHGPITLGVRDEGVCQDEDGEYICGPVRISWFPIEFTSGHAQFWDISEDWSIFGITDEDREVMRQSFDAFVSYQNHRTGLTKDMIEFEQVDSDRLRFPPAFLPGETFFEESGLFASPGASFDAPYEIAPPDDTQISRLFRMSENFNGLMRNRLERSLPSIDEVAESVFSI